MRRKHGANLLPKTVSKQIYQEEAYYIPKSSWIDLYFDLYRQTINDAESETTIMEDAKNRLNILKRL